MKRRNPKRPPLSPEAISAATRPTPVEEVRVSVEAATRIQEEIAAIFAAQQRILDLAGFQSVKFECQVKLNGERFWPDAALRVAESMSLTALGKNPNEGRMP